MTERPAHYLLVGDSADLGVLRDLVEQLPLDSYGQIYVEVASRVQVERWDVPPGMSLSWLRRDRTESLLGGLVPRGELAARAVSGWVAEWMPEGEDPAHPHVLWIGCSASEHVDRLYRDLARRLDRSRLHHPHHPHPQHAHPRTDRASTRPRPDQPKDTRP